MKKLFLSSLFKNAIGHLHTFAGGRLQGKTVTFIPTAAIPNRLDYHVKHSKKILAKAGLVVDELEISTATNAEITGKLQNNDYIYVGGGNTFYLLQEMKRTCAGDVIKQQIEAGKLFIGESAGSILLAPNIEYTRHMDDTSAAPHLANYSGLNSIDFYPLPHVKDFTQKKAVKKIRAEYESTLPLVPINNSQVILVAGTEMQIVG